MIGGMNSKTGVHEGEDVKDVQMEANEAVTE